MSESPVTVAEEFDSSPGAAAKPYRRKRVTYGSAVDALKDMSAEKKESVMDATDLLPVEEEPSQKESSLFASLDDDEENGIQTDDDDKSKDGIQDDMDSEAEQEDNTKEKRVQQEMEPSVSDAEKDKEQSEEAKHGIQEDSDSDAEQDEEKVTAGRTKRVVAAKEGSTESGKKDADDVEIQTEDDEKDDSAKDSTTDDGQVEDEKDGNADSDSPTNAGKEKAKARSVKKKQPKPDALILSMDNLFVHADKETVTVSDIVRSLEAEYEVKLDKPTRSFVRSHLTSLMTGDVEPTVQDDEESEEEQEASDYEEETKEASDDEEEETKKKPKKKKAPTRRRTRRKPPKKKPSAVRIHAEALRKRRIEELKVRNEELQLKQNKADQERAQQIAKKFETNTDELLLKRMEDRLDLLQKLDQKRITVISAYGSQTTEVANETQDQVETEEQDASSSEDDSSDEEMELEIIGVEDSSSSQSFSNAGGIRLPRKSSALSMLDMACEFKSKPKRAVQTGKSRATLRSALVAKQRKAGNMWLARELGYKTEEEHLRDCMLVESKKREEVVKKEEERVRTNERKLLRERMLTEASGTGEDFEEEEYTPEADGEDDGDESDEEMAMAKEIEAEAAQDSSEGNMETAAGAAEDADAEEPTKVDESSEEAIEQPLPTAQSDSKSKDDAVDGDTPKDGENDRESAPEVETPSDISADTNNDTTNNPSDPAVSSEEQGDDAISTSQIFTSTGQQGIADFEADTGDDTLTEKEETNPGVFEDGLESVSHENSDAAAKPSKDGGESEFQEKPDAAQGVHDQSKKEKSGKSERNSGWKALLQKEAEKLKKSKGKKNGNSLVEAEAEEEEEEEVAGLEDFGFTVHKKTDDGDEEAVTDKVTEEDLKHVVDDLSDDEGDEDAGAAARKKLEQEEEKERHKEIIRRMREGYDGRRGGIAGAGVGARGIHRFDQLVAADNRDDAKRLGLLNDDEVDSDDDGEDTGDKGEDEIEDENALLDKMLKDRFLNRTADEQVEENFSEDEEEEEEKADGKENNDEDAEQKEQERLAKRFAKRARMQRLIEQHGEDEEFSRSRLIDEDETTRLELKMMKSVSRLSRGISISSSRTSQSGESETGSEGRKEVRGLSLGKNSLSLALQASRRAKKKKTSFLGGNSGAAVKERSLSVKSVALGHVVFNTGGESQHSKPAPLNGVKKFNHSSGKRKRAALQTSTSLWKKVSANGFKKSKMGAR